MSSTIQVRVDDELKNKADELFKKLGTDTTSAIRMFLTQSVMNNGFPFEIKLNQSSVNLYAPLSENELMQKLEYSMRQANRGEYRSADSLIEEMKGKYGL